MANLSNIITPSNILTASNAVTLTNKTISGASNTVTNISLSTAVTGTLPVANGGTGAASLTANNVLLGNGTSTVQAVAPGTSGNVLTSNGTTWQSTAPAATGLTLGTPVATTSGTEINFTGIPNGVKQITISFDTVSVASNAAVLVGIGDSGGIETTGYLAGGWSFASGGTAQSDSYTNGFGIRTLSASNQISGAMVLTLLNSSANTWSATCIVTSLNTELRVSSGIKSLSAVLDRVQIFNSAGAAFDNGSINIAYF